MSTTNESDVIDRIFYELYTETEVDLIRKKRFRSANLGVTIITILKRDSHQFIPKNKLLMQKVYDQLKEGGMVIIKGI